MTDKTESSQQYAGRIEGGIDAIVIGASVDGLAAAAYLARRRFKTVLVDARAEIGGPFQAVEVDKDFKVTDGNPVLTHLDPQMVEDLELYRFGLEFARRRLETVYFFDDGEPVSFGGDVAMPSFPEDISARDAEAFAAFMRELLAAGEELTGGGNKKQNGEPMLETSLFPATGSLKDFLNDRFNDPRLANALAAEASFGAATAPHEPFGAATLAYRYAGEAAGLRGARAYPKDGLRGLMEALRRSLQSAGVTMKMLTPVESILIEGDRAAGVQLEKGGQLRAPIVISALDAKTIFFEFVGAEKLDIAFAEEMRGMKPLLAEAHFHAELRGAPSDDATKDFIKKRLVFAPSVSRTNNAYARARSGNVPGDLILDVLFPNALETDNTPARPRLSVRAFPLPFKLGVNTEFRNEIERGILNQLSKLIPSVEDQIDQRALRLIGDIADASGAPPETLAEQPPLVVQVAKMQAAKTGGGVTGLYFCGPEASLGGAISGKAARLAAIQAIADIKIGKIQR